MIEELNLSPPESNICLTSSLVVLCSDANTFLEHSCTQHSLPGRSFIHLGMWLLFARTRVISFLQAGQTRPPLETFSLAMYLRASTFFHCDGLVRFCLFPLQRQQDTCLSAWVSAPNERRRLLLLWICSMDVVFLFCYKLWICAMITFQLCLLSLFPYL